MDIGDKVGGITIPISCLRKVHGILEDGKLLDIGHDGPHFTWINKHSGFRHRKERLYRVVIQGSDHSYLILDSDPIQTFSPRPFRFKWACMSHLKCGRILLVWNSKDNPNGLEKVKCRLDALSFFLRIWNK